MYMNTYQVINLSMTKTHNVLREFVKRVCIRRSLHVLYGDLFVIFPYFKIMYNKYGPDFTYWLVEKSFFKIKDLVGVKPKWRHLSSDVINVQTYFYQKDVKACWQLQWKGIEYHGNLNQLNMRLDTF